MKDRILKLCKRLKNCTLNDITQLMDIEPSVLEVILLFLINENKIQEKDGIYSVIEELPTKNGIESKNLLHAFDKFAQIENSLSRKAGGTGLGLPIAKQLLDAHKGAIWCDSEINKGSKFYFIIPVSKITTQV